LTLRVALEKLCAIAGTYLKAIASTISLVQLLSRYGSLVIGLSVALPLFPFNAAAQFAVIGEQFTVRVLVFALVALLEVAAVAGIAFGVIWGVDSDHHLLALVLVVTVAAFLLAEMAVLVFTDRSILGVAVAKCCCGEVEGVVTK
jgi:hypothetical protein